MSERSDKPIGRRRALVGLGATAGVAATAWGPMTHEARADHVATKESGLPPGYDPNEPMMPDAIAAHGLTAPSAEVAALFAALPAGAELEGNWRVEAIYDVRGGAIPVVLSTRTGRRFALEVVRHDPRGPEPVALAAGLAVTLSNRGAGHESSDESFGLGAQALGRALGRARDGGAPIPEGLLTHGQRRARFPAGIFHVPLEHARVERG